MVVSPTAKSWLNTMVEYYGGILAGSKGDNPEADRAVPAMEAIKSLSSVQLRFHYLVYSEINRLYESGEHNLANVEDCRALGLFVPASVWLKVVGIDDWNRGTDLVDHFIYGLRSRDMLFDKFHYGFLDIRTGQLEKITQIGIVVWPNLTGAELFVWASGREEIGRDLLLRESAFEIEGVNRAEGCVAVGRAEVQYIRLRDE